MALFYLYQRYTSELPPEQLLARLYQIIAVPPNGAWRRIGYWLQHRCKGDIRPATASFRATVPHGRSSGARVAGQWRPAAVTGSVVELRVQLALGQPLGLSYVTLLWLTIALASGVFGHPFSQLPVVALGLFPVMFLVDAQWSIRRAATYFREALQLSELATSG